MNGSNHRTSGQAAGPIETLDRIIREYSRKFGRALKKAPIALVLVIAISFSTGALSWNFIDSPAFPPPAPSVENVGLVTNVSVIRIIDEDKDEKKVFISFPTQGMDDETIRYLVGKKEEKCKTTGTCKATVKNVDQGDKDYSGSIHQEFIEFEERKVQFTIVFTGKRDFKKSDYVNVWAVQEFRDQESVTSG